MMKVVYVYLAIIFGGALIALVYFRGQDRGWLNTIVFFGVILSSSLYFSRRAKKKQQDQISGSEERNTSDG